MAWNKPALNASPRGARERGEEREGWKRITGNLAEAADEYRFSTTFAGKQTSMRQIFILIFFQCSSCLHQVYQVHFKLSFLSDVRGEQISTIHARRNFYNLSLTAEGIANDKGMWKYILQCLSITWVAQWLRRCAADPEDVCPIAAAADIFLMKGKNKDFGAS